MDEDEFSKLVREQMAKFPSLKKSTYYMYDQMMGFYYAVAWSKEPWLLAIIAAEVIALLLVLFARKSFNTQVVIFLSSCITIYMAESINRIAGERWQEFSTQNYFDKHGVFTGTVLAAPLLAILTLQLILTLRDSSHLMVTVKRHEFKKAARQKNKIDNAEKSKEE